MHLFVLAGCQFPATGIYRSVKIVDFIVDHHGIVVDRTQLLVFAEESGIGTLQLFQPFLCVLIFRIILRKSLQVFHRTVFLFVILIIFHQCIQRHSIFLILFCHFLAGGDKLFILPVSQIIFCHFHGQFYIVRLIFQSTLIFVYRIHIDLFLL